jgi:hypothetical protein
VQYGDHRPALMVKAFELIEQDGGGRCVDRGERFVHEDDGGVLHDQPREQRPLQFARRQFAEAPPQSVGQPDSIGRGRDACAQRRAWPAERTDLLPAAQRDQFRNGDRIVGIQRRKLRQIGQSRRRGAHYRSGGDPNRAGNRRQQRGFPGTVRAYHRGEAAGFELAADRLQRHMPAIADGYSAQDHAAVGLQTPLPILPARLAYSILRGGKKDYATRTGW